MKLSVQILIGLISFQKRKQIWSLTFDMVAVFKDLKRNWRELRENSGGDNSQVLQEHSQLQKLPMQYC